jgi:hypothetical protein
MLDTIIEKVKALFCKIIGKKTQKKTRAKKKKT